ncbi:hypothetical protein CgunFtcFv8_009060 [Champsocephalus gunnari]|uniref:DM1 domain-containing protein n=1 Tax=Champsocephalus gunnari TaxID=52237 RepID=A0AAN8D166_CHAGU|nr:hypothetical protein CgunFtcFv8_009060 [Champsocephalus gunnari]
MDLVILEFRVPMESNKTLFVWGIPPSHTEAQIYGVLFSAFSSFGPLYLLKVFPSAPPLSPWLRSTDGKKLLQSSPLKVRLSSRRTPHFLSVSRPLSHARCLDLANHCLGFNGWTSDIITLKELTNEEEEGEDEEEGGGSRRRLKFGCLVQLCFPRHNVSHRGAAVLEDSFTCSGETAAEDRQQVRTGSR